MSGNSAVIKDPRELVSPLQCEDTARALLSGRGPSPATWVLGPRLPAPKTVGNRSVHYNLPSQW